MTTSFKDKVHQHFLDVVQGKITIIQKKLDDLKESLSGETKSTAGDKHETARAFVHIEQENTARQLQVLLLQKAALESISGSGANGVIDPGALVQTNRGYLYLSAGIGKSTMDGQTIFALSLQSPLGKKLIGCKVGDTAEVNGMQYTVEHVF